MKKTLKLLGIISGLAVGMFLISVLILYSLGKARLNKVYDVSIEQIKIPSDTWSIEEGKRIFQYRGCEACHGENLQGLVYLDNPAIGKVITPNLTTGKGGIGLLRTNADLQRAIKHGLRPDGTPLLFMPSTEFYYMSYDDLGKVLAYIRSVPAVDNEPDPSELSFTGFLVMNITHEITFLPAEMIQHDEAPPKPPEPGITPEYGQYLAISCMVCHGASYSGGDVIGFPPEWPAAPNLTSGTDSRLPNWGIEGFIEIIRNGSKHGRRINKNYMPWTSYRYMTDDELHAVYEFLMALPAKEFGNY